MDINECKAIFPSTVNDEGSLAEAGCGKPVFDVKFAFGVCIDCWLNVFETRGKSVTKKRSLFMFNFFNCFLIFNATALLAFRILLNQRVVFQ